MFMLIADSCKTSKHVCWHRYVAVKCHCVAIFDYFISISINPTYVSAHIIIIKLLVSFSLIYFTGVNMTVSNDELVESFKALGLSEQKAKETLKNTVVTKNLTLALHEVLPNFI